MGARRLPSPNIFHVCLFFSLKVLCRKGVMRDGYQTSCCFCAFQQQDNRNSWWKSKWFAFNIIFPFKGGIQKVLEVLEYTWCMWTQGLEYTWCMWTQWLEYTLPMLFLIFVRLLRQCTPSCSLLKYTYTKLSQLQPWAPAAATSADSNKCLHSRST